MKYFKFAEVDRTRNPVRILAWYIDFAGGHAAKYNVPCCSGHFYVPGDDDFYVPGICDGGGYMEVEYADGTIEKLQPIGVYNEDELPPD